MRILIEDFKIEDQETCAFIIYYFLQTENGVINDMNTSSNVVTNNVANELNASASAMLNSTINELNLTQEERVFIAHIKEVFAYMTY